MKLNKLKLNEISKNNLTHKEMRHVVGGGDRECTCSCYWADQGGSSVNDNCRANFFLGSEGGYSKYGSNYPNGCTMVSSFDE